MKIRIVDLNHVPKFSDWPTKLILAKKQKLKKRTAEKNEKEYNKEKWGLLLKKINTKKITVKKVDNLFVGKNKVISVINKKIVRIYPSQAKNFFKAEVFSELENYKINNIAEIGAGYGSILLGYKNCNNNAKINYFAYEKMINGIKCIKKIDPDLKLSAMKGDFNKPKDFKSLPEKSIIYTCMSAMMIPRLKISFFNYLIKKKPKAILHFESVPDFCEDDLLGILQKKYIKFNDYNTNLFQLLKQLEAKKKIKIVKIKKNILAENFLLPTSLIIWKPI
jgi:hypothetical protein